jgi:hypothetical protein
LVSLKERDHLKDMGVEDIILKWMFRGIKCGLDSSGVRYVFYGVNLQMHTFVKDGSGRIRHD